MDPKSFIPHREPFLLVDEVTEIEPGVLARGWWIPNASLAIFEGHFPGRPTLPGVYMVESLAQLGACALLADPRYSGKLPLFGGIDRARFRRLVLPEDKLDLEVRLLSLSSRSGRGEGTAKVNGMVACEVVFFFIISSDV